jgi:hypothetical protein
MFKPKAAYFFASGLPAWHSACLKQGATKKLGSGCNLFLFLFILFFKHCYLCSVLMPLLYQLDGKAPANKKIKIRKSNRNK